MKRQVFRIFLVAMTVLSLVMMGIALSVFLVQPEASAEMNTPMMQNYAFERTTGDPPKWNVTARFGEKKQIGSFDTPHQALIKAHQHYKQDLDAKSGPMQQEAAQWKQQTETFLAAQQMDEAGINNMAVMLAGLPGDGATPPTPGRIQFMENELFKLSAQSESLSVAARSIRDETADRRTDVLRLRHELDEVRTDLYRLKEIRRDLTDRLVRLQIENQELKDRQDQLSGPSNSPKGYDE